MNLDEQLRGVLSQQAEMQNPPRPDLESLISGGRVRRRRRNTTRLGIGVLAAALVGGGVYGVTQIDPGNAGTSGIVGEPTGTSEPAPSESATTPPTLPLEPGPTALKPGTYRLLVGDHATDARIEADLTFEDPRWSGGNYPVISESDDKAHAGVGVYQPSELADGTGCIGDKTTSELGDTPHDLAEQLARLPRSIVDQPPTPTEAFGYDALHLRLRIDVECEDWYQVAETPRGSRGITYPQPDGTTKNVIIDFWVLDLAGSSVVVDQWHNVDASDQLVDQVSQARDSITFVTGS